MTLAERVFIVRGFSPMSIAPQRVQLEDVDTGECLELFVHEATDRGRDNEGRRSPRNFLSDVSKGETW